MTVAGELLRKIDASTMEAQAISATAERPISDDRRWIARLFLGAFVAAVFIVLVATVWLAYSQPATWKEPAQALLAIVAQVLLPVVTLVIGFYFRSEAR